MKSLSARLVVTLSVLLVVCFGFLVVALDLAFRELAERSRREVLEANVLALISLAELDAEGRLAPPGRLAEPRLETIGSGLYAAIVAADGRVQWRSPSTLGTSFDLDLELAPGARSAQRLQAADGTRLLAFALGVAWEGEGRTPRDFVFVAAESLEPYYAQLNQFRVQLLAGFAVITAVLLAAVVLSLRKLLRPLRQIEHQIAEIEAGGREQLDGQWPRELDGVASNLNALLRAERDRLARYRNMLGNLAHSLKTPLSVLRGLVGAPPVDARAAGEQLDRMQEIVQHQLNRAAATGPGIGVSAVPVAPVLRDVAGALAKVHADRALAIDVDAPEEIRYPIDRGDCLELAGNLADNACKWARSRVRLSASSWSEPGWRRPGLRLRVEDDGPGIPEGERERVLGRGVRLDERVPGQGLGLSMVRELVAAHGGRLELGTGGLGGLAVDVRLPGA
ncbi:MAG: ATP-binding protein [Steroidobacteraceae bacterium]|jgi:two-component system sensor histidine kinase PhoQ|nr:ATP-binding protein [Steroidobacteraceae bacterium]